LCCVASEPFMGNPPEETQSRSTVFHALFSATTPTRALYGLRSWLFW